MKKNWYTLIICCLVAMLSACQNEDDLSNSNVGYLRLNLGVNTAANTRADEAPYNPEQIAIRIISAEGEVVKETSDWTNWAGQQIALSVGTYTLQASSAGFDGATSGFDKPYYAGSVQISIEKNKAFSSEIFTMDREEKQKETGFEKELTLTVDQIEGTITNHTGYDLVEAGMIYNGMYVPLGNMKNGETVSISSNDIIKIQRTNAYSIANVIAGQMSDRTREERARKYQMLNLCSFFGSHFEDMETGIGYLFGLTEQYQQDYVETESIAEMGKAFFYESFKQMPEDAGDYYVQNISDNVVYTSNYNFSAYDNCLYNKIDEVEYEFDSAYDMKKVWTSALTNEESFKKNGLRIFMWNYKKKRYERVFTDSKQLTSKQVESYIVENRMRIKFKASSDWTELPMISVSGMEVDKDVKN